MTLATAIVIIETLATFSPPPVAIVPDKMSGFYIACPNGIYHYEDDTLAQNTSRADNEMLSGITDIAFSGQWLYVAVLSQQIVSVETPIVWSSSSKYIAAGVERDVSFGISNDIENIYLSDRDIAYFLSSGEMVICGQPPIEWTLPTPSQIVIEKIAKNYTIYCIIENKIVEVVVKWE